ncbi:MAG: site-specific integrase [Propionibacteriales bacterium]|nr:site-specific integrase [Propionibacteriales bacterium]
MSTSKRRGNREGSNPVRRKDGRWQVHIRYSDDSGAAKRTTVYGTSATEAREKADEVRDRLRSHLPAKDRKVTLARFTTDWIGSTLAASDRKATTKAMYATVARKHIVGATIGTTSLDKLKPSHVEAWKVELQKRGLSESTIRSAYTILRAVLDTAVRDDALAKNPAEAVARPKVTRKEAAYLTTAQVRTLLEKAEKSRYAVLFELLVNTGLRRGEALALTWSDVDYVKKLIRVRGTLARVDGALVVTEPKTEKSKRVIHLSPASERVVKAVRLRQKEDRLKAGSAWVQTSYVFTTETGEPCDPRNALRALKVAAEKASLPGVGLHTLRHSAATVMIENGVPLKVVSEILGHFSVSVTGDIYGHVSPDVSAQAMDALGAALKETSR